MSFRENFKAQLHYSGMRVKELAALSGINQHTLNNYLSNRGQIPSVEAGVKIAKALGISVESLVNGEPERLDVDTMTMIRIVKNLSGQRKKIVLGCLKLFDTI